jgi:hypothetical protein
MLNIDNFITELKNENPRLGLMMDKVRDAVNQAATVLGIDATSHISPPSAPQSMNVKANNGTVHVTIQDGSQRGRSLNYFVEADTDPAFSNPHVEHLGPGRGRFFSLPGMDDDGDTQNWHFRSYSMNPGSQKRSEIQYFGGAAAPTAVDVGGTTMLTPLPSTGSGTASTTGQQGGQGFGNAQFVKAETGANVA